ncbi:MAG: DMT family transporter [Bacteroidota bacterium]
MRQKQLVGFGLALVGAFFFSSKAVFIKLAYQYEVDPVSLLTLRMLFALPFFVGTLFYQSYAEERKRFKWKDWVALGAFAIMGYYLASLMDFIGLQYLTASLERVLLFIYPTFVMLLSALFLRKRITSIQLVALAITYTGILIIFYEKLSISWDTLLIIGALWVVGAAITYAVYLVGSEYYMRRIGSVKFTALAMTIACSTVVFHYTAVNGSWEIFQFPLAVYIYVLMIAIFATVIPSFLISEAIARIGAGNVSIVSSIGPVSTMLLAYLLLGERYTFWQVVGTLIVIGGILLITLMKGKT